MKYVYIYNVQCKCIYEKKNMICKWYKITYNTSVNAQQIKFLFKRLGVYSWKIKIK